MVTAFQHLARFSELLPPAARRVQNTGRGGTAGPVTSPGEGIGPSLPITDMSTGIPDSFRDHVVNSTALGRLGTAEEIADVVAFLASKAGRWINDQTLYADGGYRG